MASFVILLLIWVRTPYRLNFNFIFDGASASSICCIEGLLGTDQQLSRMAMYQIHGWQRIRQFICHSLCLRLKAAKLLRAARDFAGSLGVQLRVIGLPFSISEHLYNAKVYLDTPALFAWTLISCV